MNNKNKKIIRGFKKAFDGFRETIIKETSFKIMLVIAVLVVWAAFYLNTGREEKALLFFVIFIVLILELINSAVERIMDYLDTNHDERIRVIKDLMAAIVLLASIGAIIVGLLIFWPYFFR
ncbi:MAG: diacylglycerol kinase family protein [Candidatus Paceibacterota bacterium]|jgi:diacylglycerol kinase